MRVKNLSLIVVCGLPGSGKSTLAEGIAKTLRLPVFSVDPIESAVIKAGFEKGFETGFAAYLVAEQLAGEQLKLGNSVIIDCVSAQEIAKQMWRDLSKKHGAKLCIIECICSNSKLHKQRLAARVRNLHGFAEITWGDVKARQKEYMEWKEPKLVIDSTDNYSQNLTRALEFLAGPGNR